MNYTLTPIPASEAERDTLHFACLIQDESTLEKVQALLGDDNITSVAVGTEQGEYSPIYVRYSQPSYRRGGQWYRVDTNPPVEPPTIVIFRKWSDGDIIALFPYETWDGHSHYCSSYMRVGQHGKADYRLVVQQTKLAKPDEYASLKTELERNYGYNLIVRQRYQRRGA